MSFYASNGRITWKIDDIFDHEARKMSPARIDGYITRFKLEFKHFGRSDSSMHAAIKMKLNHSSNPRLLINDHRNISIRILNWPFQKFQVNQFCDYVVIFTWLHFKSWDLNLRDQSKWFHLDWQIQRIENLGRALIEYEQDEKDTKYALMNRIFQVGDVKMFYEAECKEDKENSNSNTNNRALSIQPPQKKRKLNDSSTLGLDHDDSDQEASNYIRMDKEMLRNESDFFKSQFGDWTFEDSVKNEIHFQGNKQDVLQFIEFIITGTINKDMNLLKMFEVAGMYGVDRLQKALTVYILEEIKIENYVKTMNTIIRYKVSEESYEYLINFGGDKYKKLKQLGNWNQLKDGVANAVKYAYNMKRSTRDCSK